MEAQGSLELINSWTQEMEAIESWIAPMKEAGRDLQILEAGCGQKWDLNLGDSGYFLTGVDLDGAALKLRMEVSKDLDRAVEGDLRTAHFEPASFDVIFNSFVLEHVPGAARVMENFARWLKPGGLVVIRIPDPFSVHGFMSRVTPHWFHVLFYLHVMGVANAGKPGYAPYPVHYDRVVSRGGMRRFCAESGLTLAAEFGTGGGYRPGKGVLKWAIPVCKRLLSLISLGKLSAAHNDLLFFIRKN